MALMMCGDPGVSAFPEGDNILSWKGTIYGSKELYTMAKEKNSKDCEGGRRRLSHYLPNENGSRTIADSDKAAVLSVMLILTFRRRNQRDLKREENTDRTQRCTITARVLVFDLCEVGTKPATRCRMTMSSGDSIVGILPSSLPIPTFVSSGLHIFISPV